MPALLQQGVTDAAVVRPPVIIVLQEPIAVSDTPTVRPPVLVAVREPVGVSDAPAVVGTSIFSIQVLPGQAAVLNLPNSLGSLHFPPRLVTTPTLFTFQSLPGPTHPLAPGQVFAGRAYILDAVAVGTQAPVHQFGNNYTIDLTYSPALLNSLGVRPERLIAPPRRS